MNQTDIAALLNTIVLTKIAPSSVHGVGVFAIRDIEAERKLFLDAIPQPYQLSKGNLSKLFPEVKELLLGRFPRVTVDSMLIYPDGCYQAYINHSDTPNYDAMNDVALRAIRCGEEITENYRLIHGWEEAFPWLAKE